MTCTRVSQRITTDSASANPPVAVAATMQTFDQ